MAYRLLVLFCCEWFRYVPRDRLYKPELQVVILLVSVPTPGKLTRPKYVEFIEIINKSIILSSSWLFILLQKICSSKFRMCAQVSTSFL